MLQVLYSSASAPSPALILRFTIDAGPLASRDDDLYTIFPPAGDSFKREKFYAHSLSTDVSKQVRVDLLVANAGTYEFYVEHAAQDDPIPYTTIEQPLAKRFTPEERSKSRVQSKHGYFNVDPILRLPRRQDILSKELKPLGKAEGGGKLLQERILSQDGIVLQSFISKWAGAPLPTWGPHLDSARDAGYNMLHFPPLNVRGASDSPYSIANQTDFAPDLFEKGSAAAKSRESRIAEVKGWLSKIRSEWGILSMTDVVLNHTASDSEWLNEHPDAGYNPHNSPHLTGATELDEALFKFSCNLASLGLPAEINSAADADAIVNGIKEHVYGPLKLWQYYVIDVEASKSQLADGWDGQQGQGSDTEELQADLRGKNLGSAAELLEKHALQGRLMLADCIATRLDVPMAVKILHTLADSEGKGKDDALAAAAAALDQINTGPVCHLSWGRKSWTGEPRGPSQVHASGSQWSKTGSHQRSKPARGNNLTRSDPKHPAAAKHDKKKNHLADNGSI